MFKIALYEPRIPQNTGNIGRTCLAYNSSLDLICPLGFSLENKYLKRAGLDYWKYLDVSIHDNFECYMKNRKSSRIIGFSKQGGVSINNIEFKLNDNLLFGREDIGLPDSVRNKCNFIATIEMPSIYSESRKKGVRSLNLSVATGIAIYTAYSQLRHN